MKKNIFKTLLLTGIMSIALAGCDDSKDEAQGPAIPEIPTIPVETEAKVGSSVEKTLVIKNPFSIEARTNIWKNSGNSQYQPITIKSATCGNFSGSELKTTLKANEECTITYTFNPTSLMTSSLELEAQFSRTDMCPNPSMDKQTGVKYNITGYAVNSKGDKSPAITNIDLGMYDYKYNDNQNWQDNRVVGGNIIFKDVTLNANEGDIFTVDGMYNLYISSNDENCTFSSYNTLEVIKGNSCNIKIKVDENVKQTIYNQPLTFKNQDKEKASYSFIVKTDAKYEYNANRNGMTPVMQATKIVDMPLLNNSTYFEVYAIGSNNSSLTFDITGTGKGKVSITGTPVDGCRIEGNKIINPTANQKQCYITAVTTTDEIGKHTATLDIQGKEKITLEGVVATLNDMVCRNNQ